MKTYGYCRVSTNKQSIERQVQNIQNYDSSAIILKESFTGRTIDRPVFSQLLKKVNQGDTIIFDEVSRMSRDSSDGITLYRDLYQKGVNLVFLKEHHLDTATYKEAVNNALPMTGSEEIDCFIEAINKFQMILAEKQIKFAFERSQAEVDYDSTRTKEGLKAAKAEGRKGGRRPGSIITTKKSIECKKQILKLSKDFEGSNSDSEVMKIIGNISRNTYYKYKAELKENQTEKELSKI